MIAKESAKSLVEIGGHTSSVRAVAISPDGQTVVPGGDDNMVRVWNLDGSLDEKVTNF